MVRRLAGGGQKRLPPVLQDNRPEIGYRFPNTLRCTSVPASDPRVPGAARVPGGANGRSRRRARYGPAGGGLMVARRRRAKRWHLDPVVWVIAGAAVLIVVLLSL